MSEIKMLPLPNWLLEGFTDPTIEMLCDYTLANVEHHTAAKDAEIEALRAINDNREAIIATHAADTREYQKQIMHAEARAERLAEALRGLLALPIAESELRHLDKGIGTATRNAAWLRARAALRDHDQEGKDG